MMKKTVSLLIALMLFISISAGAEESVLLISETEEIQTEIVQEINEAMNPETSEESERVIETIPNDHDSKVSAEASENSEVTEPEKKTEPAGGTELVKDSEFAGVSEHEEVSEPVNNPDPEEVSEKPVQDEQTNAEKEADIPGEIGISDLPGINTTEETIIIPETGNETNKTAAEPAVDTELIKIKTVPVVETETTETLFAPEAETIESEPVPTYEEKAALETEADEPELPEVISEQKTDTLGAVMAEETLPAAQSDILAAAATTADVLPACDYEREDSVRGFVYRLYHTVLQRDPDETGFLYWMNLLDSGDKAAADVIDGFFNSDEYKHSGKSNDQIIKDCYNTMLNRSPDEGGSRYWNNRLNIGMTPQSILAGFVESAEFTRIADQYGVIRGDIAITNPRDKNYERTYFVYRLYQNCLSRNPDVGGQEDWCYYLENGMSGANVTAGFFFSDEFNKNRYDNPGFVQILYKAILGREYDTAGLNYWRNKLNYTDSRERVLNGFIGSNEFARQCQTAEIIPGDPIYEPDNTVEWQYNIEVLQLCNEQRRKAGLRDLYTREDLLWDVAMERAQEITERWDHVRPDGTAYSTLFIEQGFYGGGENLAAGLIYRDPTEVVEAWMGSKGHKENILNTRYNYLATGLVFDPEARTFCTYAGTPEKPNKYYMTHQQFGIYSAQAFCINGQKIK